MKGNRAQEPEDPHRDADLDNSDVEIDDDDVKNELKGDDDNDDDDDDDDDEDDDERWAVNLVRMGSCFVRNG
jgi:hypothetical protein